jgi:hypothetical protein
MELGDPAVARQQRVEGPAERDRLPGQWGGEADGEPDGMYSGVGAAGSVGDRGGTEEPLEHALELHLHRAARRLALPPDEPAAVEVQRGEKCPAHRPAI